MKVKRVDAPQECDILQEHNVFPKYFIAGKVTICSLLNKGNLKVEARGLSICSPNDVFDVKEGRKFALWMAASALLEKDFVEPIILRRFHTIRDGKIVGYAHLSKVLLSLGKEFSGYKGEYRPIPWECEVQAAKKIKAMRKKRIAQLKAKAKIKKGISGIKKTKN